jgi:hypothetical protein
MAFYLWVHGILWLRVYVEVVIPIIKSLSVLGDNLPRLERIDPLHKKLERCLMVPW